MNQTCKVTANSAGTTSGSTDACGYWTSDIDGIADTSQVLKNQRAGCTVAPNNTGTGCHQIGPYASPGDTEYTNVWDTKGELDLLIAAVSVLIYIYIYIYIYIVYVHPYIYVGW